MTDTWFIADTHFGHANIIRYCNRPFANADEMDEALVENWNKLVKPADIVWHLGDVYMGHTRPDAHAILRRLNGRKNLILGNHDQVGDGVLPRHFEKIVGWRKFKDHGFVATHFPLHPSSLGGDTRHDHVIAINVHGHTHDRNVDDPHYVNLSVEKTMYRPVHIDMVATMVGVAPEYIRYK